MLLAIAMIAPAGARADDEVPPPVTPPRVVKPDDVLRDKPVQPGEHSRRTYLSHGRGMSTAVMVEEERFPTHCHPSHDEALYVIDGHGTYRIGARAYQLAPGDIAWIPRDTLHGVIDGSFVFFLITAPWEYELYPDTRWATEAPLTVATCSEFFARGGPRSRVVYLHDDSSWSGTAEPAPNGAMAPEHGTKGIPVKIDRDFTATLYGFTELDAIFDTTHSFDEITGNTPVVVGDTGSRTQFSIRNTRLGLRVQAPRLADGLRLLGQIEGDFFGPSPGPSEAAVFDNPGFRIRHAFVRAEARPFYAIAGQFWALFGWQPLYQPGAIDQLGLLAEPYSRTAQVRLGLRGHAGNNELDLAVAALRPPQRDVGLPDLQAGLRWSELGVRAGKSWGAASTGLQPLSVAVSGAYRLLRVTLPDGTRVDKLGRGVDVSLFAPIVPARDDRRGWTLSLTADASYGQAIADQLTRLTGGATLPDPTAEDIAPGVLGALADGSGVDAVTFETAEADLELYLGAKGRLMLAGGAGVVRAPGVARFAGQTFDASFRANGTVLWEIADWFRVAGEYMYTRTEYTDGSIAPNHRVQLTSLFLF